MGVTVAVCSTQHSHRDLCSKVCPAEMHADSDWCGWEGNSTPGRREAESESSVDQSDRICDTIEDFVREVMEKSICKVTSSKVSPLPRNWKTTSSLLAKETLNRPRLQTRRKISLQVSSCEVPKAAEEKTRELKERADQSSKTPESLVVQTIHSATSRETNYVSQEIISLSAALMTSVVGSNDFTIQQLPVPSGTFPH
ncbi:hypothetical protein AOLI_G00258400 [Acnodon oligacanthus]